MTSISPMTGTGLKKCTPMKRAGSGEWAAMRVIGIELVFDAMMASPPSTLPAASKILSLISSRSVAASMMKVGFGHRGIVSHRGDAVEQACGVFRRHLAAADQLAQRLVDAGLGLFGHFHATSASSTL
jgi:hypothetical protein